jgi:hypothetical protein
MISKPHSPGGIPFESLESAVEGVPAEKSAKEIYQAWKKERLIDAKTGGYLAKIHEARFKKADGTVWNEYIEVTNWGQTLKNGADFNLYK